MERTTSGIKNGLDSEYVTKILNHIRFVGYDLNIGLYKDLCTKTLGKFKKFSDMTTKEGRQILLALEGEYELRLLEDKKKWEDLKKTIL